MPDSPLYAQRAASAPRPHDDGSFGDREGPSRAALVDPAAPPAVTSAREIDCSAGSSMAAVRDGAARGAGRGGAPRGESFAHPARGTPANPRRPEHVPPRGDPPEFRAR